MKTVKCEFEFTEDYIRGIISLMGHESSADLILDKLGDKVKVDIDKSFDDKEDAIKFKMAIVCFMIVSTGFE